jgi:hypothetical protein
MISPLGGHPMSNVEPKSWFGFLGSVVLGVTFAMTACGGDDGDDGGSGGSSNGGSSNGGTSTAGAPANTGGIANATGGTNASAIGGTSSSTGGVPSSGGVAGRQQFPGLRRNLAPSAN